jgi:hypothetical protein
MRDIAVLIVAMLALAACSGDDGSDGSQCGQGGACEPGDTCAGFESDFECAPEGYWKCVPSGRVYDPCVADAGVDATVDGALVDAP